MLPILNDDILCEIAIIMLDLYPKIQQKLVWKMKCDNLSPGKPYLCFWDGSTNYLIKQYEFVDIVMNYNRFFNSHLYMGGIECRRVYCKIKLVVENRFVIVK